MRFKRLQLIPSYGYECLNSKKNLVCGFSFDSISVNDEWQLQIDLLNRSVHVQLIFQQVRHSLYDQLERDVNCCQITVISVIGTVSSACLIYQQVSIDHQWSSAAVTHHLQSYCHKINCQDMFFKKLKTWKRCWKDVEKSYKKGAPATPNFSDLCFGTNCSHSQSHDTIPLTQNSWGCEVACRTPLSLSFLLND